MKTLAKTLTLDTQFKHLYRPLARNLFIIVSATILLGAGTVMYFDNHQVTILSERLIEHSTRTTARQLQPLIEKAEFGLGLAQQQLAAMDLAGPDHYRQALAALKPFFDQFHFLDSVNLADTKGNEFVLIKEPDALRTREIAFTEPQLARWRRWAGGEVIEQWTRKTDVSPLERPWFQGALQSAVGVSSWSAPYAFLTTKEPGVSVSTRWRNASGDRDHVLAFNISLIDISHYTTQLRPSEHGMNLVFDRTGRAIGLPPDPRFEDEKVLLSAILSPVTGLGLPALDAGLNQWEASERQPGIFRFALDDQTSWWAGFSILKAGKDRQLWSATLIPEDDLLGSSANLRNLYLAAIGTTGLLLGAFVFVLSMRSIRRQMKTSVDQVERRLGQYQLKQKIGEGANGAVYRATHALLRRPTAIKLMNPEYARSQAARERFEREVQLTSELSHPNTIAIYDYGRTPDGTLYYAMELLTGVTLEHLVRVSGPLPAGRAISILEQMTGSLAEAHAKGLIHRDIKLSNAILCERGGLFDVVKVLDFGLVKEMARTEGDLTHANVLIGTPLFMAPEIISKPGSASALSDLYALGVVGYFLLTGRHVFVGEGAVEICAQHLHDQPITPAQRLGQPVPADLEAIIMACLEKDPGQRPADAEQLRTRLLHCHDRGAWTQQDARTWWQSNTSAFAGDTAPGEAAIASRTEILVDLDNRLTSTLSVERQTQGVR